MLNQIVPYGDVGGRAAGFASAAPGRIEGYVAVFGLDLLLGEGRDRGDRHHRQHRTKATNFFTISLPLPCPPAEGRAASKCACERGGHLLLCGAAHRMSAKVGYRRG